jgi:molecular chaperone GrpE
MTKKKKEAETMEEKNDSVETEEILEDETEELSEVDQLKQEVANLKDQLLRNTAELQNFKRRMNDERIKDRIFANVELVKKLITPLDNLELGLLNETEDGKIKPYAKGFEMIRRDLMDALKEEGLKPIEGTLEAFNPNLHQAVATEKRDDLEPNTIVEVYQKGYQFKERLIRPAMVKVSEK